MLESMTTRLKKKKEEEEGKFGICAASDLTAELCVIHFQAFEDICIKTERKERRELKSTFAWMPSVPYVKEDFQVLFSTCARLRDVRCVIVIIVIIIFWCVYVSWIIPSITGPVVTSHIRFNCSQITDKSQGQNTFHFISTFNKTLSEWEAVWLF